MKFTAAALLLATSTQAKAMPKDTLTDVTHVFEGVLMGALDAEFQDIEHCIVDGEHVVTDVENAYQHLKSKDVQNVIEGLKDVGDALMQIKKMMSDCKDIKQDFTKLAEMAAIFSNPESAAVHIGKDLIVHGVDIYHEVKASISAYEKNPRDYYDFGFNIGKAAAQIILGQEDEYAVTDVNVRNEALVLKGLLKPFGGHFSLDKLGTCLKEEGQALVVLDAAVKSFEKAWETKSLQELIGGIMALVGFVQQFSKGLPDCEAIDTTTFDYAQFQDTVDIAAHPFAHFELKENDLHMHGKSVLQNVHNGVYAYKHGDYEQFGELMGQVLKIATQANYDKAHLSEATDAAIAADKNMYLY